MRLFSRILVTRRAWHGCYRRCDLRRRERQWRKQAVVENAEAIGLKFIHKYIFNNKYIFKSLLRGLWYGLLYVQSTCENVKCLLC